jgi:hypothetical protein
MGMKSSVHPHLGNSLQTKQDTESIMEMTDPKLVNLIVDTGHTTMAGMDPVRLTRFKGELKEPLQHDRRKPHLLRAGAAAAISRGSRRSWTTTIGKAGGPWSWIVPAQRPMRVVSSPGSIWNRWACQLVKTTGLKRP